MQESITGSTAAYVIPQQSQQSQVPAFMVSDYGTEVQINNTWTEGLPQEWMLKLCDVTTPSVAVSTTLYHVSPAH